MSFAKDTKLQVLLHPLENTECELAFMGGLLHAVGEFDIAQKSVSFLTDIPKLYNFTNDIITRLYGQGVRLEISDDMRINKTKYYRISLPTQHATQMLQDFGILSAQGQFLGHHIDENLLVDEQAKKSFVKGVFVGSATSSIKLSPAKTEITSTGYNVEFVSHSHGFLLELSSLLAQFGIIPRLVQRKKHFVLYIKESNQICDLLAMISAYDSVIKLQDELALRELRNKINRQTNCVSANITKTVNASLKQVQAIQTISNTVGLESLPMELQEIALVRIANPEESLSELQKLLPDNPSRSALNHRLSKLLKIAKSLDE